MRAGLAIFGIVLATPYNSPMTVTTPVTPTVQVKEIATPITKPADLQATFNPQS